MVNIPLVTSDWERSIARDGPLVAINRYIESNPALATSQQSFVARPGLRPFALCGTGPVKSIYSCPGSFDDLLFVSSGSDLLKVQPDGTVVQIASGLNPNASYIPMAAVSAIGDSPERLFYADDNNLYVYSANLNAVATVGGTPTNGDTVQVGDVYYQFTTGNVNDGTPLGTSAFPWLLAKQLTALGDFSVLFNAIMAQGEEGFEYSTGLSTKNSLARAAAYSETGIELVSISAGVGGNSIGTSSTGGITITAFTGGGGEGSITIPLPNNAGCTDLVVLNSFVCLVPSQTGEMVGRLYFIEPGEISVDPLNYVTAESASDKITGLANYNNQLWLFGTDSVESWYFTGDLITPLIRAQGINYNRGGIQGSATVLENLLLFASPSGEVLQIGNGIERVSNLSVEEAISTFINKD